MTRVYLLEVFKIIKGMADLLLEYIFRSIAKRRIGLGGISTY